MVKHQKSGCQMHLGCRVDVESDISLLYVQTETHMYICLIGIVVTVVFVATNTGQLWAMYM